MQTIVVGYDGSDSAERALRRAAELAEAFSARLVAVSVRGPALAPALEPTAELVPPPVAGTVGLGGVPLPEPAPGPDPEELARAQLERARKALASRKVETEYVVELGDPAERLLAVADERDADLIVLGRHEHSAIRDLLLRTVADGVVHHAHRPVLVVPTPTRD